MPAPIITGRQVAFPAGSAWLEKSPAASRTINEQTVTLDACTSGSETKRIYWKQGLVSDAFANLPVLSFVGRTAISGASAALVGGSAVAGGNVKVHVRGKIFTDLVVSDPLQQADVTYSYKRERYDLLELDKATGVVHVVKGIEHDFYAAEQKPNPTAGRVPLFWAYVWNDTVELISAGTASTGHMSGSIKAAQIARHRARNASILAPVIAKLQAGTAVVMQAYGDSITAQGGGWAATGGADDTTYMATAPGGDARDQLGYLTYRTDQLDALWGPYPTGWIDANDDGTAEHQTQGWAYGLSVALAAQYGSAITFKNWGIGATSSGSGNAGSGAPNGSSASRLPNVAADAGDVIFVNFGMNDFVGFATGGLRAALKAIVSSLQTANPSRKVVLMGAPGINTENPNNNSSTFAWWYQHHATYLSVALEMGCAYIPMELTYHGGPALLGISAQHYSGTNRYNHPGPFELRKVRDFVQHCLAF